MTTDWRELLDCVLDGEELTPEEMAALREALSDDQRRDRAAQQVQSRYQLFGELSAPAVDDISLSRDRVLAKVALREKSLAVAPSQRSRRRIAMNRRQLWIAGATAVALTVLVLGLTTLRNRYPQPTIDGDFYVVRDGQEVSAGQRVDRGEKIIAGQGEAELRLGGYCHLVMKPHTELVLNGQPGAEEVELRSGSLASHIVPGQGEFTCRTPLGIVRVLGTEFVTTVEYPRLAIGEEPMKESILVTVAVVSGIVAFDLAGQSGTLSAGDNVTLSQNQTTQTKTGVVRRVEVEGKKIVVMVARELTFTVTENTRIHQRDDAKNLDDIKVGDKVAVEYTREDETRTAKSIAILAEEKKEPEKSEGARTKEGEVKKVDGATAPAATKIELKVGDKAPAFKLVGTDGKEYSLEQFAGKSAVALCWYLRAGSGGSRVELSSIQAEMEKLAKYQVQVLGITVSKPEENAAFAKDLALTFPLLSDPQLTVANAYGALRATTGPTGPVAERWVILIDAQGIVRSIEKSEDVQSKGRLLVAALETAKIPVK